MSETVASVTIANGASLSGAISVQNKDLRAIVVPSSWTTADLSLSASVDGGTTYANVFDSTGEEVVLPAAASRYVPLDGVNLAGVTHIKVRSGTSGTAVNQGAARTLQVVLQLAG